jgi:hypothetical protein
MSRTLITLWLRVINPEARMHEDSLLEQRHRFEEKMRGVRLQRDVRCFDEFYSHGLCSASFLLVSNPDVFQMTWYAKEQVLCVCVCVCV